ncbi:MAG TPA: hypothetical protein VGN42_12525 [Pirellulales bacterium]|jgi:hypothetical protein|nr:hypothetical protein [Pirellulales bacterium]
METIVRNVRDLDQTDRSALERVVGRQLGESQQVVIQVMNGAVEPAGTPIAEDQLPAWCDVYEGLSDARIDELDGAIIRDHSSRHLD